MGRFETGATALTLAAAATLTTTACGAEQFNMSDTDKTIITDTFNRATQFWGAQPGLEKVKSASLLMLEGSNSYQCAQGSEKYNSESTTITYCQDSNTVVVPAKRINDFAKLHNKYELSTNEDTSRLPRGAVRAWTEFMVGRAVQIQKPDLLKNAPTDEEGRKRFAGQQALCLVGISTAKSPDAIDVTRDVQLAVAHTIDADKYGPTNIPYAHGYKSGASAATFCEQPVPLE